MEELATYVVRVYRKDNGNMTGTVESVESGEQASFHSNEQLWRALYDLPSPRPIRQVDTQRPGDQT